jgi:hypothetical protein
MSNLINLSIKLLVKMLLGRKDSFFTAVKIKDKVYLFEIEEYVSASERIEIIQEKMLQSKIDQSI